MLDKSFSCRAGMQLSQVLDVGQRKERFASSLHRKRMVEGGHEIPVDMTFFPDPPASPPSLSFSPREQSSISSGEQLPATLGLSPRPRERSTSSDREHESLQVAKSEPQEPQNLPWRNPSPGGYQSLVPGMSNPGLLESHRHAQYNMWPLLGRPRPPEAPSGHPDNLQNVQGLRPPNLPFNMPPLLPVGRSLVCRPHQERPLFPGFPPAPPARPLAPPARPPAPPARPRIQSATVTSDSAPRTPSPATPKEPPVQLSQRKSVIQTAGSLGLSISIDRQVSSQTQKELQISQVSNSEREITYISSNNKEITYSDTITSETFKLPLVETEGFSKLDSTTKYEDLSDCVILTYVHKKFRKTIASNEPVRESVIMKGSLPIQFDCENILVDESDDSDETKDMDIEEISKIIEFEDLNMTEIQDIRALCFTYLMEEAPYMETQRTSFFNAWHTINLGDNVMKTYIEFSKTRLGVPASWMQFTGKLFR